MLFFFQVRTHASAIWLFVMSQRALKPSMTGQFFKSAPRFWLRPLRPPGRRPYFHSPLNMQRLHHLCHFNAEAWLQTEGSRFGLPLWIVTHAANTIYIQRFIAFFLLGILCVMWIVFVCVAEISNLLVVTKNRAPEPQTNVHESQFIFHRILKDDIKQVNLRPTLSSYKEHGWQEGF